MSSENLLRSTASSGAVIKSISCPISVWNVTCGRDVYHLGISTPQRKDGFHPRARTHLVEELEEVDVVRLLPEVLLQEVVDRRFEHEGVVDRNVADVVLRGGGAGAHQSSGFGGVRAVEPGETHDAVPARLASPRDTLVHHVICNEEVRLELRVHNSGGVNGALCREYFPRRQKRGTNQLDAPAENGRARVLVRRERLALDNLDRVDRRDAAVQLACRSQDAVHLAPSAPQLVRIPPRRRERGEDGPPGVL